MTNKRTAHMSEHGKYTIFAVPTTRTPRRCCEVHEVRFILKNVSLCSNATGWPEGLYGLPNAMPLNGCPANSTINWKTGTLYNSLRAGSHLGAHARAAKSEY